MSQRVLVTGGGTGIGRAVVKKLVGGGAQVVITGRRAAVLDAVVKAHPGRVHAIAGDLTDARVREGLVEKSASLMGGIDGLVHSAGVVFHEPPGAISDESLRAQLELNLVVPLRLGEDALRVMRGGAIVFISSTLALRPVTTSAVYSAAKAGMLQVMRVLAMAGAEKDIRVNAVLPGVVDTEMVRAQRDASTSTAQQLEALRALHPLGRLGSPEDVADAVVYLLSSTWTTGTELVVDGGLLLPPRTQP